MILVSHRLYLEKENTTCLKTINATAKQLSAPTTYFLKQGTRNKETPNSTDPKHRIFSKQSLSPLIERAVDTDHWYVF